ncbi:Flp family type IVb pilin [Aestuariispira ectoiniformans]|uniref:Flp family type IVb pilin n=1 Tax=Aestuariispira ectoiniformans TaxID=2775080 RepID=UPI00223AE3B0|nr:Flp family type IVb pilin [Aestuariispira ectoiniformans]
MINTFKKFVKDESGATAIEYGLIAALVSVAGIAALTTMGGSLKSMFEYVGTILSGAVSGGTTI